MVHFARVISRKTDLERVRVALKRSRVVALLGLRQCGKTTLARQFVPPESLRYFDLEDPAILARLSEPDTALRPLNGLVVIGESMRIALEDLQLDELHVVYPGEKRYPLARNVEVIPLAQLAKAS